MPRSQDRNPNNIPFREVGPPSWMPSISKKGLINGALGLVILGFPTAVGYFGYGIGSKVGYSRGYEVAKKIYEQPVKNVGEEDWVPGCPPGLWVMPARFNFELNPFDNRENLYRQSYSKDVVVTAQAQQRMTDILKSTLINHDEFFNFALPNLLSSTNHFLPHETGWQNEYTIDARGQRYENNGNVCIPDGSITPSVNYIEERDYKTHRLDYEQLIIKLGETGIQIPRVDGNFSEQDLRRLATKYLREQTLWRWDQNDNALSADKTEGVVVEGIPAQKLSRKRFHPSGTYRIETEYVYSSR